VVAPTLWIIGGPDGVGKTTYALAHLRRVAGTIHLVNADELARGVSPLDPAAAGLDAARLVFQRARHHMARAETFAIESTLSGRTHLRLIAEARAAGFVVALLYFWVPDREVTLARIARRVAEGGHDVARADVERRWPRSMAGFARVAAVADLWRLFDATTRPFVVAEGRGTAVSFLREEVPEPFRRLLSGIR